MNHILVVSGHPDYPESVVNKRIIEELQKQIPAIEIDHLSQLYPDYRIHVEEEQQKLINADIIVLQFPFYWYAIPSLLGRWIETVFLHGFSHGTNGNQLRGKKLIVSFTSGASKEAYQANGRVHYQIEDFLPPIKATANLCGMDWIGYVYTGGVSYQGRMDPDKLKLMNDKAVDHACRLMNLLSTC